MDRDDLKRLKEEAILPAIKKIASDLDEIGWCCAIGSRAPQNSRISPDETALASLSIADIENRLVQYVYVFYEDGAIRVLGDGSTRINDLRVEPDKAESELDGAIRTVIDLGV